MWALQRSLERTVECECFSSVVSQFHAYGTTIENTLSLILCLVLWMTKLQWWCEYRVSVCWVVSRSLFDAVVDWASLAKQWIAQREVMGMTSVASSSDTAPYVCQPLQPVSAAPPPPPPPPQSTDDVKSASPAGHDQGNADSGTAQQQQQHGELYVCLILTVSYLCCGLFLFTTGLWETFCLFGLVCMIICLKLDLSFVHLILFFTYHVIIV